MRYLVFFKTGLLRHFDRSLLELADAGHEVVFATPHERVDDKIPRSLLAHDNVSVLAWRAERQDGLQHMLSVTRRARDYLRYLDPQLKPAWANRERAWRKLAGVVSLDSRAKDAFPSAPWYDLTPTELQRLGQTLATIESLVPADPSMCAALEECAPDAVLITPLVTIGSRQTDIITACRAVGIPSGLLVFSWDNLSNKGLMHVVPDAVFVWNELQKREAVELHGVPAERVVITGAPRFDEFFALSPTETRERFLRRNGLDDRRKVILYLGSAPFVCPDEPTFVAEWLDALRTSGLPELQDASVFIRPHPRQRELWQDWDRTRWPNVAIDPWPSISGMEGLYDQIHHSDVVVGLNTSGQLEAAILGKPVYTINAGERAPGQEGSSHYRYLLREDGGFVEYASSLGAHFAQLAQGLRGDYDEETIAAFVRSFIRPCGLDRDAAPILTEELVAFGRSAGVTAAQ